MSDCIENQMSNEIVEASTPSEPSDLNNDPVIAESNQEVDDGDTELLEQFEMDSDEFTLVPPPSDDNTSQSDDESQEVSKTEEILESENILESSLAPPSPYCVDASESGSQENAKTEEMLEAENILENSETQVENIFKVESKNNNDDQQADTITSFETEKSVAIVPSEEDPTEESPAQTTEVPFYDYSQPVPCQSHPYHDLFHISEDLCILPYMHCQFRVTLYDGQEKMIYDVNVGDTLVDQHQQPVTVTGVFKIEPKCQFIRFGTGSLQCREPNREPSFDAYVSPTMWFCFKHTKEMDCENIINGNSISRTSIEHPSDVFLICTESGDYVNCGRVEFLTMPQVGFEFWLNSPVGGRTLNLVHKNATGEWVGFPRLPYR